MNPIILNDWASMGYIIIIIIIIIIIYIYMLYVV